MAKANIVKRFLNGLDSGTDAYKVWVEETDGDGIKADLTELASDIPRDIKAWGGEVPEWVTQEIIEEGLRAGLEAAHATILKHKPA